MPQFKFKTAGSSMIRLAYFDEKPSWGQLTSEIDRLFNIHPDCVRFAFVDKDQDTIILNNDQDLQTFYQNIDPSSEVPIKFFVQDSVRDARGERFCSVLAHSPH